MQVSVICTVLNEEQNVGRLLESLVRQTRQADEVVICDGGSTDRTVETIRRFCATGKLPNLKLLVERGVNISQGRNRAIAAARGPIIASTDVGVRLSSRWLEKLIEPWETSTGQSKGLPPIAVAGFFLPDVDSRFGAAMSATVLPLRDDVDPERFLPSSRSVAFCKEAWVRAGGYPEWLDYCEDLLFDFAVNAQRPKQPTAFVWAPEAVAFFRPRGSLRDFWRQYYRYARGDGKADLWRKRHAARYVTYLLLLPALLGHAIFGQVRPWLGWLGLFVGIGVYCYRPWQRLQTLGKNLGRVDKLWAASLVPVIRAVGDVAKMVGYPVGLVWRWQNRHRPEIHWRQK